jgi:hypothetical protein
MGIKYVFLALLFLMFISCSESTSGSDDWFGMSGITYDGTDSTVLRSVIVKLTDFSGHVRKPIADFIDTSDSSGNFTVLISTGYFEVKNIWGTEIYKVDSCKAVFSKLGYQQKTVTLTGASFDTAMVYLQKENALLKVN